jgi:hypothetical protein
MVKLVNKLVNKLVHFTRAPYSAVYAVCAGKTRKKPRLWVIPIVVAARVAFSYSRAIVYVTLRARHESRTTGKSTGEIQKKKHKSLSGGPIAATAKAISKTVTWPTQREALINRRNL